MAINPNTAYIDPDPKFLSLTEFNAQKVLDAHESALNYAPYNVQKNVCVFFYSETLLGLMGASNTPAVLTGIEGILFHFAKDGDKLALIARSSETQGSTPVALKDKNWMSTPNEITDKFINATDWCTRIKAFYADNYALVKNAPFYEREFDSTHLLMLLFGNPLPPGIVITEPTLTFHFVFCQKTNDWSLNLACKLIQDTPSVYAVLGEECPPNCYPGTLSSVIQNLVC